MHSVTEPNAHYNSIKTIEEQSYDVDPFVLRSLAKLYLDHNHAGDFGICLLHRHHSLPSGHVMAHYCTESGKDVCCMEAFNLRLHPCAFRLDERKQFSPYEFSTRPQRDLEEGFLLALSSFLLDCDLQEKLGICAVTSSDRPWVETLSPDGQGTVAMQVDANEFVQTSGVVTEWIFVRNRETFEIKEHKKCVRPEGGGHRCDDLSTA